MPESVMEFPFRLLALHIVFVFHSEKVTATAGRGCGCSRKLEKHCQESIIIIFADLGLNRKPRPRFAVRYSELERHFGE